MRPRCGRTWRAAPVRKVQPAGPAGRPTAVRSTPSTPPRSCPPPSSSPLSRPVPAAGGGRSCRYRRRRRGARLAGAQDEPRQVVVRAGGRESTGHPEEDDLPMAQDLGRRRRLGPLVAEGEHLHVGYRVADCDRHPMSPPLGVASGCHTPPARLKRPPPPIDHEVVTCGVAPATESYYMGSDIDGLR